MLDFLGFVFFSFPVCLLPTSLLLFSLSFSLFCSALNFGAQMVFLYSMVVTQAPLRAHFSVWFWAWGFM